MKILHFYVCRCKIGLFSHFWQKIAEKNTLNVTLLLCYFVTLTTRRGMYGGDLSSVVTLIVASRNPKHRKS